MDKLKPESIRNVALLAHGGSGKTSLAEALLFTSKTVGRMGKVDEGTTVSDYDPDEIKRKISISLTLLPLKWQGKKINIIDTPGYSDFAGEVKAALRVSESAVILVSATSGVAVGGEQTWKDCNESGLSCLIFVNKMDRENANFNKVVEQLGQKFTNHCLPLQIPIGAAEEFKGVIDLLKMKAYLGEEAQEAEIPAELKDEAQTWKDKLVEAVAELDDEMIEKYLGGEEITAQELEKGLAQAVSQRKLIPILAGSALKNIGISSLLDNIVSYLPSSAEKVEKTDNEEIKADVNGPLAALVFKTTADPYVGKLTYFRVYSGTISSNTHIWNATHEAQERIGQLFTMRGKEQESTEQISAGDIGAVAKLSVTNTGDTLGEHGKKIKIEPIDFPKPIFNEAIHPKTKADLDKLGTALSRLVEEDPTLEVKRDTDTGETIISGMGETQLGVVAERMARKFGVGVELSTPKVPYKETITIATEAEHKHKKQSGGHGQYGHVKIKLEPLPRGTGMEFVDKIVGGSIPRNYIPSVQKGIKEQTQEGVLIGSKVEDVRIILYDGSFHAVDSSDICFKIAGAQALKKGLVAGQPILIEPIVNLKVTIPNDFTGDVIGDLNTKRAHVQGMNPSDGNNEVDAQAPLAEVQRYAIDLKSLTQGQGTYTVEFSHYAQVPVHKSQQLTAEKQAEKEAKI